MQQKPLFHFLSTWIGTDKFQDQDLDFQKLQQRSFRSVLDTILLIGLAALISNLYSNVLKADYLSAGLSVFMYGTLVVIRFIIPKNRYTLQVVIFLLLTIVEGLSLSLTKTTVGDGRIWLLIGPIAAALFLNIQSGFIVLALNMVGWFGIGFIYQSGILPYPQDDLASLIAPGNIALWLNTGAVLLTAGVGVIMTIAILFNNLNQLLEHSQSLSKELQEKETERSQAKAALNSSENRYRRLIENSPDLIMEVSYDLQVLSINPAMRQSIGVGELPKEEIDFKTILGEEAYQKRLEVLEEVHKENRPIIFEDHRNDRTFKNQIIPDEHGKSVQVIAHDITEYKRIQHELLQHHERLEELVAERTIALKKEIQERERAERSALAAQKMADIGLLTTGVAHELNSPLQAILSNAEVTLRQLERSGLSTTSLVRGKINAIKSDVHRCSQIVRSLQYHAHTSPREREIEDLKELVEDTLLNVEHEFSKYQKIKVESRIQDNLPGLSCDRNQLQRALINLLLNARDALQGEGSIIISVRYEFDNDEFIFEVEDNGVGIPLNQQEHIFKPFFTTKVVGEGTGLGLYLVSGIVQAHGGEIGFESEPGKGTTFTIILPSDPPDITSTPTKGRYEEIVS